MRTMQSRGIAETVKVAEHYPLLEVDADGVLYAAQCACKKVKFDISFDGEFQWIKEWQQHILALQSPAILASVEAREKRIAVEARLEEAKWWLEYHEANCDYDTGPTDAGPKRIADLQAELENIKKKPE